MAKNMNDKCTEVTFRFGLHGDSGAEDFLAKTDDEAVINQAREQLAKPEPERRLIITGPIQRGSPGSHLNWRWQHIDSAWEFTNLSMELCDAKPSYVESNLDQWLDQVGRLCPWSSYVKYEVKIMNRKIFKLLILLGVFLLLVTACNGAEEGSAEVPAAEGADASQAAPPAEVLPATEASGAAEEAASGQAGTGEPYKIGLFFSVTGPISSLGIPERDTAMMVVEQVNAAGGIQGPDGLRHPLEVVFEDDQSNPDEAVLIVKKLIEQDQVPVIVGGSGSPTSMAVIDLMTEAQVPFISLGSASSIVLPVEERQWIFKTPQQNRVAAQVHGEWLAANGITRLASLGVNNAFGADSMSALQGVAEELGLEIVYEGAFEPGDTDFSAQLTQVAGSEAEALIVHATPAEAAPLTVQFRDFGLEMPMLHNAGVGHQDFIDLAGEAADGVLFPNAKLLVAESLPDTDPQKEVLMKYIDDYAQYTGGSAPSIFGAHGWDAMQMSLMALQAVGPDPVAIRDYLENIQNFVGLSSVFNLSPEDHNGIGKESLVMIQIRDGDWVYVEPQEYASVR